MTPEARTILENIVKIINGIWDSELPDYHGKIAAMYRICEKAEIDAAGAEAQLLAKMYEGFVFRETMFNVFGKRLIGTNIFTPCLFSSGWAFWKKPMLTAEEREALEAAWDRWLQTNMGLEDLVKPIAKLPNLQTKDRLSLLAEAFPVMDESII